MALISIDNIGRLGLAKDTPAHELPPNVWSGGRNVRMVDGKVQKFLGHAVVFDPPTKAPYWVFPVPAGASYFWVYAGFDTAHKMYTTDMNSHGNITRQTSSVDVDYNSSAIYDWSGGVLGGIPLFNNSYDAPQFWSSPSLAQRLADLTNWPAGYKTKTLRVFKQFAIALDITTGGGTRYKDVVKWSHPADPGTLPVSWDPTDSTKDAGEQPLSETPGAIVESLAMRNANVLYKDDAVFAMQYTGRARFPFSFTKLFGSFGIVGRNCVREILAGKHVLVTSGDLDMIVHDGVTPISVLDKRWKSELRNTIDQANIAKSFMFLRRTKSEVWFCYPASGSALPNKALVWNWVDNTLADRDMPLAAAGEEGIITTAAAQTWASVSGTWGSGGAQAWDYSQFNPTLRFPLFAVPGAAKLYQGDVGQSFAGTNMTSYAERSGLSVIGMGRNGLVSDLEQRKFISEIRPKVKITGGSGTLDVYVASQERPDDTVVWNGPYTFNPLTDVKVDCAISTRLWGVRFQSTGDLAWELYGYAAEVVPDGYY